MLCCALENGRHKWKIELLPSPSGSNDQPRFFGGRVLTLCWWIFCIVIVSSYTANMAATLTARLANDGIPSLDDVLRDADNSFFVDKDSALHWVR